jgi:glycerate kinase
MERGTVRILLAPQEFKGSLTAVQAAAAMAAGVRRALPSAVRDPAPMADGGPGTVAALVAAAGGELRRAPCRDPLGRGIEATFGLIEGGRTAVIEMAAAAGLTLLRPAERDPLRTGTEGVGDLIRAALDVGAGRLIVGLGGSATNDGGAGMARALGARLLDREGHDLPPGGAALRALARVDVSGLDPRLRRVEVVGATDVRNPLCGPTGASAVYGPQKGATPARVRTLDGALRRYAAVLARDLGVEVAEVAGAGAAGGLGAGLIAFLGATLRSGFALVAEAAGLEGRIAAASLVLTGEGRLDGQSLYGKTTVGVARIAARHGVPCVTLCGALGEGWANALGEGMTAVWSIVPGPLAEVEARRRADELLASAAEQVVRLFVAARRGTGTAGPIPASRTRGRGRG